MQAGSSVPLNLAVPKFMSNAARDPKTEDNTAKESEPYCAVKVLSVDAVRIDPPSDLLESSDGLAVAFTFVATTGPDLIQFAISPQQAAQFRNNIGQALLKIGMARIDAFLSAVDDHAEGA